MRASTLPFPGGRTGLKRIPPLRTHASLGVRPSKGDSRSPGRPEAPFRLAACCAFASICPGPGEANHMIEPRPTPGTTYFRALVAVSVVLTLTTLAFRFHTRYFLWLAPLDLSHENDVATWFSGMVLLLAALQAMDGFRRLQSRDVKTAVAWLLIAAMLVVLSADEIGSLHERIEDLSPGSVRSFVPFAIGLVGASVWVLWRLWRTPSERAMVPGLVLGFAMLFSVGGLEIFERLVQLPWYARPFRTAFEEGWELAGMLVLIYAMRTNSRGSLALSGVTTLRWFFAAIAALIAWPLASLTATFNDQANLGHLSDWLS